MYVQAYISQSRPCQPIVVGFAGLENEPPEPFSGAVLKFGRFVRPQEFSCA